MGVDSGEIASEVIEKKSRMTAWRDEMRGQGYVKVEIWIKAEDVATVNALLRPFEEAQQEQRLKNQIRKLQEKLEKTSSRK